MSIRSGCCCNNSESSVFSTIDNDNRRRVGYSGIIRPLAFLIITSLLGKSFKSQHLQAAKSPLPMLIRLTSGIRRTLTRSHDRHSYMRQVFDQQFISYYQDGFIKFEKPFGNPLGNRNEVKHVMKMRDKLEHRLGEIGTIISKISQDIHQLDIGDIRVNSQNIENVRNIIKYELSTYDGDKSGRIDYALEASGGRILSIRDTISYMASYTPLLTVMGISLCHSQNTPRFAIQSGVLPGQCWAFHGQNGCIVIKLFGKIYVSSVSIEHITKNMSPTGETTTAPRDFSVWGLRHVDDPSGFLFGEFTYNNYESSIQDFPVQNIPQEPYEIIEVKFHSNSGNSEYTCVYRIRVHGTLDR